MTQRIVMTVMIVLGLVLVGVGSQWNRLRPAASYWTAEQASEYTAAQTELHALSHNHEKGGGNAAAARFTAAKERFAKISGELEGARNSRGRTGTLFIAAGIISVLSAVTLHFRNTPSS